MIDRGLEESEECCKWFKVPVNIREYSKIAQAYGIGRAGNLKHCQRKSPYHGKCNRDVWKVWKYLIGLLNIL